MSPVINIAQAREKREGFYQGFCAGYNRRNYDMQGVSAEYVHAYLKGFDQGERYRDFDDIEADRNTMDCFNWKTIFCFVESDETKHDEMFQEAILLARAEIASFREKAAFEGTLEPLADFSF